MCVWVSDACGQRGFFGSTARAHVRSIYEYFQSSVLSFPVRKLLPTFCFSCILHIIFSQKMLTWSGGRFRIQPMFILAYKSRPKMAASSCGVGSGGATSRCAVILVVTRSGHHLPLGLAKIQRAPSRHRRNARSIVYWPYDCGMQYHDYTPASRPPPHIDAFFSCQLVVFVPRKRAELRIMA